MFDKADEFNNYINKGLRFNKFANLCNCNNCVGHVNNWQPFKRIMHHNRIHSSIRCWEISWLVSGTHQWSWLDCDSCAAGHEPHVGLLRMEPTADAQDHGADGAGECKVYGRWGVGAEFKAAGSHLQRMPHIGHDEEQQCGAAGTVSLVWQVWYDVRYTKLLNVWTCGGWYFEVINEMLNWWMVELNN